MHIDTQIVKIRLPYLKLMFQQLKRFSLLFLVFLNAQLKAYIPHFFPTKALLVQFLSCHVLHFKKSIFKARRQNHVTSFLTA